MESIWERNKTNRNIPNRGIIKITGSIKFRGNYKSIIYGDHNYSHYESLHLENENGQLIYLGNVKVHTKILPTVINELGKCTFYFLITEGDASNVSACILLKAVGTEVSIDIIDDLVETSQNLMQNVKFQAKLFAVPMFFMIVMFLAILLCSFLIYVLCQPCVLIILPHVIVVAILVAVSIAFVYFNFKPSEAVLTKDGLIKQLEEVDNQ